MVAGMAKFYELPWSTNFFQLCFVLFTLVNPIETPRLQIGRAMQTISIPYIIPVSTPFSMFFSI